MLFELSKQLFSDVQTALQKTSEGLSQSQFNTLLQKALAKQGLVTREEFDAQKAVLTRTREKVEALELQLRALEAELLPSSKHD